MAVRGNVHRRRGSGQRSTGTPSTALGHATRSLASRQIRNSATVGGNICGGGRSEH